MLSDPGRLFEFAIGLQLLLHRITHANRVHHQLDNAIDLTSPKKSLVAVIAGLASGFALLLFVFARQALRNAAQDPDSAEKISKIRKSLGLRS